jgi:hypothetical protein
MRSLSYLLAFLTLSEAIVKRRLIVWPTTNSIYCFSAAGFVHSYVHSKNDFLKNKRPFLFLDKPASYFPLIVHPKKEYKSKPECASKVKKEKTNCIALFLINPMKKKKQAHCILEMKGECNQTLRSMIDKKTKRKRERQSRNFEKLKKKIDTKYHAEKIDLYYYELFKKASKKKYGTRLSAASGFFGEKAQFKSTATRQTFQQEIDTRKSEFQEIALKGFRGIAEAKMGIEDQEAGQQKTIVFENVKNKETLILEAITMAGHQVLIYINDELVDSFKEAPQLINPKVNLDSQDHPETHEIKKMTINTESRTPISLSITFRVVFTESGAIVHHLAYPIPSKLASIGIARKLN